MTSSDDIVIQNEDMISKHINLLQINVIRFRKFNCIVIVSKTKSDYIADQKLNSNYIADQKS